ncbi:MAG: ATP-binding protein [Clostridiales bacterium]|nr:ATP-binding protein [Clostridiales bacterium]
MKTQKKHILWFILIRLIAVTSILVAVVIIQSSTTDFIPLIPFYYLVLLTYLMSLVYLCLYWWRKNYSLQAFLQIFVDLLLITALVYISGGLTGGLYLLYVFPVIAASIVLSSRATYITAGLAAVLFGFLVDGLYFGLIPYFSLDQHRERSLGLVLFTILVAWSLFILIAVLADRLTSSLRKAREELLLAQKELEVKERLATAGRIAAQLAHEIRNPLAAISGAVQFLKNEMPLHEDEKNLMEIVLKESVRVSQSIEQFLDLASPGKRVFSDVKLSEAVEETLALLRASGDLDGSYRLAGNFSSSKLTYYGNANQFKQVFWNLSRNALKAMPEGGTLTVDFNKENKKEIKIKFADTGRGLREEEKNHLFEPFFSRFENGRGLGLVVVRRIVDDYDGKIQVNSAPGHGTEIILTLPVRGPRQRQAGSDSRAGEVS